MDILITNDIIRIISFFLSVFIILVLRTSFSILSLRRHVFKIYKAIDEGDEKTAHILLNSVTKRQLKNPLFINAAKSFDEKFLNHKN